MHLFDTHCHLDFPAFDEDRPALLVRCRELGVRDIVVPGVAADSWGRLLSLTDSDPHLYPALGLHPMFLSKHQDGDIERLEEAILQHRPIAMGEIGLDYYIKNLDRQRQLELFKAQLKLARCHGLPVLLHIRKAHDDVLAALKRVCVPGGIAHAFNGSEAQARRFINMGFKLGFGGALTYERARRLRHLAKVLPASAIVLETDAPDMSPFLHRGERNSPAYLPEILDALAQVKRMDKQRLAKITSHNARAVFGLAR